MTTRAAPRPQTATAAAVTPAPTARRWLLFVHQLPSTPSNLRVKTWRRLQQLGAIPIKQAVYVLPDTPGTREDFEWLKTEVKASGGDASLFAASSIDSWSDDELVEEFRRSRQEAYAALAREVDRLLGRLDAGPRRRKGRAPAVNRLAEGFRERLAAIEQVDFFGSAGRDRVAALLKTLEERASPSGRPDGHATKTDSMDVSEYGHRLWVTRPRPGVDRMSSAWLIRRFVDPDARFGFAADRDTVPEGAVPFDMFGVDLSHRGEGCTFETLCAVFAIDEPAVGRIAAIVHDLDLKDGRFGAREAPAIGTVIEGLQLSVGDDESLLAQGMALFESLYRAFDHASRKAGPRRVAGSRSRKASSTRVRR